MTLNVTVLTPVAVYQSADFRLVDSRTGALVSNRSPKSIELNYESWSGVATYTGLGGWEGRDLSVHMAEWLSGEPKLSMTEVARVIAAETAKLLDRVARDTGLPRFGHTVTLAGFVGGRARVSVISNFEDGSDKPREAVDAEMAVSTRELHPAQKARVLVTGRSKAVSRVERRAIKRLAEKHPSDGARLRVRLEQLNERAAASDPQTISKDCAVVSLRADGSGMLQLNRSGENPPWFPSVNRAPEVDKLLTEALSKLGLDPSELQVVGYSRAVFRPGQEAVPEPPCEASIVKPDDGIGYELVEISSEEVEVLFPGGQNEDGIVVGTARAAPNTAHDIPWVWDGSETRALDFEGTAVAINSKREVAGMAEPETALLIADGKVHELADYHGPAGVFAGSGSSVCAINDRGEVAGEAHSAEEEEGHPNRRPALFRLDRSTLTAMDVPSAEGSKATQVNGDGLVLVWASPAIFEARTIVWEPHTGSWRYAGEKAHNVIPLSLLENGTVLGMMRYERAKQAALIAPPGKSWHKLEMDERLVPVAMNDRGEVVGYGRVDGFERPWLRTVTGKMHWLPYLRYHSNRPMAVNMSGQVIGFATADHGNHVLVWRRNN